MNPHATWRIAPMVSIMATLCGAAHAGDPARGREVVTPPDALELSRIAEEVAARELAEALELRQRLRLAAFLHIVGTPDETIPPLSNVASIMPELGLGVRIGLGTSFDFQARTGFAAFLGDLGGALAVTDDDELLQAKACAAAGAGAPNAGHVGDATGSVDGFTWDLDATLRWRYAGGLVPAFIGIGPWFVIAHATGTNDNDIFCSIDADFDHDVPASYRVERSATTLLLGGVFEIGTYLGREEQLEIGFRAGYAPALTTTTSGAFFATLELYFGAVIQ